MSTAQFDSSDTVAWSTLNIKGPVKSFESDSESELSDPPTDLESELSDPPTDLESEDGQLFVAKSKEHDELDQAYSDNSFPAGHARDFDNNGFETQSESGGDYENLNQSDIEEDSEDEWEPSCRMRGFKATAAPLKMIMKRTSKEKTMEEQPQGAKRKTKTKVLKTNQNTKTNTPTSFLCPWLGCGQRFGRQTHLRRHAGSHSDAKLFRCPAPFCGHATKRKDNLVQHLKYRHKLSVTAARKGADQAAQAALTETRTLAAAVHTAIADAVGNGDVGPGQNATFGKTRGAKRTGREAQVGASDSASAGEAGVDQATSVDIEDQIENEIQSNAASRGQDRYGASGDDDDDGTGVALLEAGCEAGARTAI